MKLAIVFPTWKRPGLTKVVIDYWARFRLDGVHTAITLSVSPEDPFHKEVGLYASRAGCRVELLPNRPLPRKRNLLMNAAIEGAPDAVLTLGSDNVLNPECVDDLIVEAFDWDYAYPQIMHFYNLPTHEVIARKLRLTGVRIYTREAIRKVEGMLWAEQGDLNMDQVQQLRVGDVLLDAIAEDPRGVALDIKDGGETITQFSQANRNLHGDSLAADEFLKDFFPSLVAPLAKLRAELSA